MVIGRLFDAIGLSTFPTCALVCALMTASAAAADIISATYTQPTTRYQHGVLGDPIEYGAIDISLGNGDRVTLTLPQDRVFEDLEPRLVDVDGDGGSELIVIESSLTLGARLSVYDETGLVAATPYIGRSNRWLAPIGAADLDGDGYIEIAYIDRPHLAKLLKIWRFKDGKLTEIANQPGLTNHRIGWDFIVGGIRHCDQGPALITASGDWSKVFATRLSKTGVLTSTPLGDYVDPESLTSALTCP